MQNDTVDEVARNGVTGELETRVLQQVLVEVLGQLVGHQSALRQHDERDGQRDDEQHRGVG